MADGILFVYPGGDQEAQRVTMEMLANAKEEEMRRKAAWPHHEPPKDERPSRLRRLMRRLNPYR